MMLIVVTAWDLESSPVENVDKFFKWSFFSFYDFDYIELISEVQQLS